MKNLLTKANQQLAAFAKIVNGDKSLRQIDKNEKLKVGVDLGTSSIVLTVLDSKDQIVYGAFEYDHAVRDGIVVDYIGSVNILRRLKEKAEKVLGRELLTACGAIPPKTGEKSAKVVANVIEETGMQCVAIEDEPTAAAKFLNIETGTVVDIGGGTTGISVFENGDLTQVIDEATGGFHMTLVLGGRYKIKNSEAEQLKRNKDKESEVYPVIKPVVEKMASIVEKMGSQVKNPVIVVGGATNFEQFTATFGKSLHRKVLKPAYPQFVTPLGIAMFDN